MATGLSVVKCSNQPPFNSPCSEAMARLSCEPLAVAVRAVASFRITAYCSVLPRASKAADAHNSIPLRRVSRRPSPIRLRILNFSNPRRSHPPRGEQLLNLGNIHLRADAANRLHPRTLLCHLQPQPCLKAVIDLQPGLELRVIPEQIHSGLATVRLRELTR